MIAALLDHLWQSTLYAAGAGLLVLALRGNSARIRYWIWLSASLKFLIPLSLLVALGESLAQFLMPMPVSSGTLLFQQGIQPFSFAPVDNAPLAAAPLARDWSWAWLALWALGVAFVVTAWLQRWSRINTALRAASPLPGGTLLPVKLSASVMEPGLVGLWHPVLLMPEGIAARLSPPEFDIVLAHEICHWRHRDNFTALAHMLVETLFWFYPLVWWLGARLVDERERACDESVLAAGHDPQIYAESLLKICRFYVQSPLACVSGLSGADLRKRIETIVRNSAVRRLGLPRKSLLTISAAALLALPLATGLLQAPFAQARAQDGTPADIAQRRAEQQRPRQAIPYDPAAFDKFAGQYGLAPPTIFTLYRQGGHFFAAVTSQPPFEIWPESQSKFFARNLPAQFSFEAGPSGTATALVWHQAGLERRAPRLDAAQLRRFQDALALRITSHRPLPGSEAALRRFLDGMRGGQSPFDFASLRFATGFMSGPAYGQAKMIFRNLGAAQSVTFQDVDATGRDQYAVRFAHGQALMTVAPPTPDGKIDGLTYVPSFTRTANAPSTGTEAALRRLIQSLENNRPDYAAMTPDLASAWRAQWQFRQAQIAGLGPLQSIAFVQVTAQGLDVYDARFARGHTEWRIAPLTQDAKDQMSNFRLSRQGEAG